jgi:hypothetical protein
MSMPDFEVKFNDEMDQWELLSSDGTCIDRSYDQFAMNAEMIKLETCTHEQIVAEFSNGGIDLSCETCYRRASMVLPSNLEWIMD